MGWHTLKRQKSAQKAAAQSTATQQKSSTPKAERRLSFKHRHNSQKEKNIKNLTIQPPSPTRDNEGFNPIDDEKVQVLKIKTRGLLCCQEFHQFLWYYFVEIIGETLCSNYVTLCYTAVSLHRKMFKMKLTKLL